MPVCRFEGRAVRTTALVIWRCTLGSGGVACGNYFWRERVREGTLGVLLRVRREATNAGAGGMRWLVARRLSLHVSTVTGTGWGIPFFFFFSRWPGWAAVRAACLTSSATRYGWRRLLIPRACERVSTGGGRLVCRWPHGQSGGGGKSGEGRRARSEKVPRNDRRAEAEQSSFLHRDPQNSGNTKTIHKKGPPGPKRRLPSRRGHARAASPPV